MRKQSGFTLIELMVVMAIIAILATAGLSAYGGYIKKARDATRIADIKAIETVVLASLSVGGTTPDLTAIKAGLMAMNNNVLLVDPFNTKNVCLDDVGAPGSDCRYYYGQCNNGGYILRMRFESLSNFPKYMNDNLINDGGVLNAEDTYDLGNCDTII